MNPLEQHERFEMEILEAMRKGRLFERMVFGGGTMLRLCHQLPRYSVDLDFFLKNPEFPFVQEFKRILSSFEGQGYEITDQAEKHFTWLVEIRRADMPRRLKIEIRKDDRRAKGRETGIAYSSFAPELQVRLTVCSLSQMWQNKIDALLDRKEIRDAYDLEFLLRRGAGKLSDVDRAAIGNLKQIVSEFTNRDYSSTLGGLLPPEERKRIIEGRFSFLLGAIESASSHMGRSTI